MATDSLTIKILLVEKRIMHAQIDSLQAPLLLQKAILYKERKDYVAVSETLSRVKISYLTDSLKESYYYEKAFAAFKQSAYQESLLNLWNIERTQLVTHEQEILLCILLLENEHWDTFSAEFLALAVKYHVSVDTAIFKQHFQSPLLLNAEPYVKQSGRFPGLGMMRSGNVGKGLMSLGLQVAFTGFGIYNFYTGYYLTGLLSGIMPARRFYLGGKVLTESLIDQKNKERIAKQKELGYQYLATLY